MSGFAERTGMLPWHGVGGRGASKAKVSRHEIVLGLIIAAIAGTIAGLAIAASYHTAFERQRERLRELAQSQARLIEAMARFAPAESDDEYPAAGLRGRLLEEIADAHERFRGFGETGEFTLATRDADHIVFLLSHRHDDLREPRPVALSSELAEPMRRALAGSSGTLVGLDYRGERVLAAHEPVSELGIGLVAKIDLAELRAPFVRTGGVVALGTLLLAILGTVFVVTVLEARLRIERNLAQGYLDVAGVMLLALDREGRVTLLNRKGCAVLGYENQEELVGRDWFQTCLPPEDLDDVRATATDRLAEGDAEFEGCLGC